MKKINWTKEELEAYDKVLLCKKCGWLISNPPEKPQIKKCINCNEVFNPNNSK
jgi:uncharacterized CHY-type Zn-finger protein